MRVAAAEGYKPAAAAEVEGSMVAAEQGSQLVAAYNREWLHKK